MNETKHDLLLAFYGDDFTGSTDALEAMTIAGARAVLFLEPPTAEQLARHPDLQVIGVAGMTRAMLADEIESTLRPALSSLRALGARHVHYKVCSTFDSSPPIGSIGRALDVAAEIFRARFIPLLVAAPALGRYTVFGTHFARMGTGTTGEVHRLDRHPSMSRHPITPADESDLRLHLAKQTSKRTALFDILKVNLPEAKARAAALDAIISSGAEVVLFDALDHEHMTRIGALIDAHASREQPLFSAGSSGIEAALSAHWKKTGRVSDPPQSQHRPTSEAIEPLLVLSGSRSPVTEQQIAWGLANGFAEIELDVAALIEKWTRLSPIASERAEVSALHLDTTIANLVARSKTARGIIVHTSRAKLDPRAASAASKAIGTALGVIAREVVAQTRIRRVIVAGGDTSSYAARALGIESLEMIAPLAPGAPLCRAHAKAPRSPIDGVEFVFKGGQVGAEDFFGTAAGGKT